MKWSSPCKTLPHACHAVKPRQLNFIDWNLLFWEASKYLQILPFISNHQIKILPSSSRATLSNELTNFTSMLLPSELLADDARKPSNSDGHSSHTTAKKPLERIEPRRVLSFVDWKTITFPKILLPPSSELNSLKGAWIFLESCSLNMQPPQSTITSENTGLFEMIVGVITTYHTQHTWDRSICVFLFNFRYIT